MSHKVIIKQSTMVKPAAKTPNKRLWLSRLDMYIRTPFSHTPYIFVYYPALNNKESTCNNENSNGNIPFFDPKILKESLSKTLVPFYPMAGRLIREGENGRFKVDCNGEGCLFVEAEATNCSLTDLEDFKPTAELRKLVIPSWDYSKGLGSIPLFMVQLTRFKCGGVILGFGGHHHVADGWGHLHLINSWARLARGLELESMPLHERPPLLAPRDPPHVEFRHVEFDPPQDLLSDAHLNFEKEVPTSSLFKLTKHQIHSLKQKAASEQLSSTLKLTTYEVVAGHIWRAVCMARGFPYDQEVRLYIPTNGRNRFKNPALPESYSGNVVFFPTCVAKSGNLTQNPSSYAAAKIHETLKAVNDEEYLRSVIHYSETFPDFDAAVVHGSHTVRCPNLSLNSWERFRFYEADFGWRKPAFAGHGGILYEGQSYLGASPNGDGGLLLSICLFADHMALFEKYLYDF